MTSLAQQFPLRLLIGNEDCSHLLDSGMTFSMVDPGGFEAASIPIPKDMPQSIIGTSVRLECGAGGVAWEGRIAQPQRSLGNRTLITCEGWGARFAENALAMIFVDRDLTQWQSPSINRQALLAAGGDGLTSGILAADPSGSGKAGIQLQMTAPIQANTFVESAYDARGMALSTIYVNWGTLNITSTSWQYELAMGTTDTFSTSHSNGNLNGSVAPQILTAGGGTYPYALLELQWAGPGNSGTAGQNYGVTFDDIAVYGNHGITPIDTSGVRTYDSASGFYPSDIATYLLGQLSGAPFQAGTIQTTDASGYIIPHLVYYTPTALSSMLNDLAQISGWTWGVYESPSPLTGDQRPRFDFRPRQASGDWTCWAWRGECQELDLRPDLSKLYDTAIITYTTVDGLQRYVTQTIDNPLLDAAGLHRTVVLDAGTSTATAAAQFGNEALVLLLDQASVTGTATITQAIHGGSGGPLPAWMLRPGQDRIRVPDLPSTDAWGTHNDLPIQRVECSIDTGGFSTSLTFGQGTNLVETVQARMQAATQIAGVG